MAKREFRKENKGVRKMSGESDATGWGQVTGPDPTSQNPGFGSPPPSAQRGTTARGTAAPTPQTLQRNPTAMQALLKELGPYASIGAMAGGIGGKKGILLAPFVAMAMQNLLKRNRTPDVVSGPATPPGPGVDIQGILKANQFPQNRPLPPPSLGAPPTGAPTEQYDNYSKGGRVKMRREFRSNGPKVRNLPVSPRKAMGMGIMSPESIPTLKRGGKVKNDNDADDKMRRGGKLKKHYADGGMLGGYPMTGSLAGGTTPAGGMPPGMFGGRFENRIDQAIQNHPQWGQQFMQNHPNWQNPGGVAAPGTSAFAKGGKVGGRRAAEHDGNEPEGMIEKKGGRRGPEPGVECKACGGKMANGGRLEEDATVPKEKRASDVHYRFAKGGALDSRKELKPASGVHYEKKGGKVSHYAKGGLIPRGTGMTTKGSKGSHFD